MRAIAAVPLLLPFLLAAPRTPAPRRVMGRANDYTRSAGTLRNGVLTVRLVVQPAQWKPAGENDPALPADAFGEEGRPPTMPGPLLRAPVGTRVRATLRNALSDTLVLNGLREHGPNADTASVLIAPGETRALSFTIDVPGAYTYYADLRRGKDTVYGGHGTQLAGAIIGDSARAPRERVMVMGFWNRLIDSTDTHAGERVLFLWNGKIWPHTERFTYQVGDTVRWRVIDMGFDEHPIHLHGFYFRVDSRGTIEKDTAYTADQRRMAVTETTPRFGNFSMTWVPERAGNWIVHCHKPAHTFWGLRHTLTNTDYPRGPMPLEHGRSHVEDGMSGLVIGVSVRPRTGDVALQSDPPSQRVRVIAQRHAGFYGKRDGYGYVMQDGNTPPASDSIRVPGAPIVVTRGVPVAVTVVNHLTEATAVHWHGIEIESFYDGVPGWSGAGARVAPMIAPGDSFVARFTPRRAGTFMYHTHHDDARQMELGLYAPLIVLEPGEQWDSTTDHVLMIGGAFEKDRYVVALNGSTAPAPLDLRADVPHRLRIINVTTDEVADVAFFASADTSDSSVVSWRAIAKDGAALPERMQTIGPARLHFAPGEIYDFMVTLKPGDFRIVVQSINTSTLIVRAR